MVGNRFGRTAQFRQDDAHSPDHMGFVGLPFEVRRRGMFMGLKFPVEGDAMLAARDLIGAGVFAVFANNDTSVLQFLPPLTVSDREVDEICTIVRSTFS